MQRIAERIRRAAKKGVRKKRHMEVLEDKCDAEDICSGLSKCYVTEPNRKGINLVEVTDIKTGKKRFVGVAFKKTEKDRGVMLNFCPSCGANFEEIYKYEFEDVNGQQAR